MNAAFEHDSDGGESVHSLECSAAKAEEVEEGVVTVFGFCF